MNARGRHSRISGGRLTRRDLLSATLGGGAGAVAGRLGRPFGMPAVLAASAGPVKLGVLLPYSKVYQRLGEDITSAMVPYFESVGFKAGLVASPSAVALRDVVHNSKTLFLIANAGANVMTRARRSPYIFRVSFSNWQTSYPMGKWFYDNVARSCLVGAADYAAGHEDIDAFKSSYLAAGGKVVAEVYPPLNNTDYGPYVSQMQKAKPEAIFVFFAGSDAARFVIQAAAFGLFKDARLAGPGFLVEEDVLPAQGRNALGAYSCLHWALTLQTPENLAFTRAYRARWERDATVYAMQGYDTARVIVEALNATGGDTTNKSRLIEAMAAVRFTSPRGPISFDPETHNVIQTVYVRQVREVGPTIHNVVFGNLGVFKDPGA